MYGRLAPPDSETLETSFQCYYPDYYVIIMVIVVVINIILISIVIIAVIIIIMIVIMVGWLWLRGTASVSLLEGRWFDYPGLHVFGQDTEPQTAPDVLVDTLHSSHRLQCMYEYTVNCFGLKRE